MPIGMQEEKSFSKMYDGEVAEAEEEAEERSLLHDAAAVVPLGG